MFLFGGRIGNAFEQFITTSSFNFELGYEPQVPFDQGLADTIAWYRDNEAWWAPVKDGVEAFYASKGQ